MKDYFPAYSEKGQIEQTQYVMDEFYAPNIKFDDGVITSRAQWYKACLSHPGIQDKITLKHLFVDEKQQQAGALVKTQAVERATGNVLVEIGMNVLYTLKKYDNNDIKMTHIRVFLESNPTKATEFMRVYGMTM